MIAIKQVIINKLPKSCKDCKLSYKEYDEDAFFGDGMVTKCIFGMDPNYAERPKECPLLEVKI